MPSGVGAGPARLARIDRAFVAARLRLIDALADHGPDSEERLFAPLGETLRWIFSMQESLGKGSWSGQALQEGVRYARNRAIHGEGLVAAVETVAHSAPRGGAIPGAMIPGGFSPGEGHTGYTWCFSAEVPPGVSSGYETARPHYLSELANREVLGRVDAAWTGLGRSIP